MLSHADALKLFSYDKETGVLSWNEHRNSKRYWLGECKTPQEASAAYVSFVQKKHGQFFPSDRLGVIAPGISA